MQQYMHIKLPIVYEEIVLSLIPKIEQCNVSGKYTAETLGRVHVLAGAVLSPTIGQPLGQVRARHQERTEHFALWV